MHLVRPFHLGNADIAAPDHGADASEGFGKPVGIAQGVFKERKLLMLGLGRFRSEPDADGGLFQSESLKVRVEDAEEHVGVGRGRGDLEESFIAAPVVQRQH